MKKKIKYMTDIGPKYHFGSPLDGPKCHFGGSNGEPKSYFGPMSAKIVFFFFFFSFNYFKFLILFKKLFFTKQNNKKQI